MELFSAMIISHKYRFIFIKTEKTAGTSIETYLSQFCSADDILTPFGKSEEGHNPQNHKSLFNPIKEFSITFPKIRRSTISDFYLRRRFFNHMPAWLVQCRVDKKIWQNYFKFCVERNPWDKTLSHYYFIRKRFSKELNLDEYLDQGYDCLNYSKYTNFKNHSKVIVDEVIRYDNLNQGLNGIFTMLGIPYSGELNIFTKVNYRTDRRPYQEVLTESQANRIKEIYKKEIELFEWKY